MITQSTDTNPKTEKFLISLIRNLTITQKFGQVISFSSSVINLSKRAIHRANPNLSEEEKNILFVKYHYGTALADKLRSSLNHNKLSNEIRN
jgi:hypothetical protein